MSKDKKTDKKPPPKADFKTTVKNLLNTPPKRHKTTSITKGETMSYYVCNSCDNFVKLSKEEVCCPYCGKKDFTKECPHCKKPIKHFEAKFCTFCEKNYFDCPPQVF